jgi:hypothetical protein
MQSAADRILRATFWGGIAGAIAGGIGGLAAGVAEGGRYIVILTPVYVSDEVVAAVLAACGLFMGGVLGVLAGIAAGAVNRPKLTWLIGPLLGAAMTILLQGHTPTFLVLATAGLIAAVTAAWRMTPKPTP